MSGLINTIEDIEFQLSQVRESLERDEKIGLTDEMIATLKLLDFHYQEYCAELDKEYNEPEGTTYNNKYGPSIEYYIEADMWHDVSLALRQLTRTEDES